MLDSYPIQQIKTEQVRLFGYKHVTTGFVTTPCRSKGAATRLRNRLCYEYALGQYSSLGHLPDRQVVDLLAKSKCSDWKPVTFGLVEIDE